MEKGLLSIEFTFDLKADITLAKSSFMKGAALLYNSVVLWTDESFIKSLAEEVSSGLTAKEKEAIQECFLLYDGSLTKFNTTDAFLELYYLQDNMQGLEIDAWKKFCHSYIRNQKNHVANSLYVAIKLGLPFHSTTKEASDVTPLFELPAVKGFSKQRPLEVGLPDISSLSWSDILELRKSPYLPRFRHFLSDYHLHPNADIAIVKEINESIWEMIGQLKPSPSGSIVKRLIANIPVPVVPVPNPYAAYKDYKEGAKEKKMYQSYGWLWFIQEARTKAIP